MREIKDFENLSKEENTKLAWENVQAINAKFGIGYRRHDAYVKYVYPVLYLLLDEVMEEIKEIDKTSLALSHSFTGHDMNNIISKFSDIFESANDHTKIRWKIKKGYYTSFTFLTCNSSESRLYNYSSTSMHPLRFEKENFNLVKNFVNDEIDFYDLRELVHGEG